MMENKINKNKKKKKTIALKTISQRTFTNTNLRTQ